MARSIIQEQMTKFKEYAEQFEVPRVGNKKALRTNVKPEDRSFKNIPKYSTGKTRVRFQDWLEIKGEGGKNPGDCKKGEHPTPNSFGKAANGKYYGWSHRAVYGFKAGDEVKGDDNLGKKVTYPDFPDGTPDFDNGKYQDDFTIKIRSWDVIFSHRKHTVWNGCELCHPMIFPSTKRGTTKYSMFQIMMKGEYCGVCHTSVAFSVWLCAKCHITLVE